MTMYHMAASCMHAAVFYWHMNRLQTASVTGETAFAAAVSLEAFDEVGVK